MSFIRYWIAVLSLSAACISEAQISMEPVPKPTPQASLVRNGNTVEFHFEGGRVASLTHAVGKVARPAIGLKQIENTCNPQQVMARCTHSVDMVSYHQYLKWSKHPIPEKLGKILEYSFGGDNSKIPDQKFESSLFHYWYETADNPDFKEKFRPDEIVCDNLDWLAVVPSNQGVYKIASWTGEQMSNTPDVNVNENQTSNGAFDVELIKTAENKLTFRRIGHSVSNFGPPYLSAQIISMTVQTADRNCQLTFETDVQEVLKTLGDPEYQKIDPASERPITNAAAFGPFGMGQFLQFLLIPGMLKEVR